MELRQLETFIAINNAGSFAQAAENLGYTQPTLTAHIQALERELKCKLFDRLGHRVETDTQRRAIHCLLGTYT